ncbi:MAG: type IV pili twitching motility protein PilT [Chloroflexota bacterium]|nr:MAG: type IV pili twitching motility protein PilT [Chloroflexota bacterium]
MNIDALLRELDDRKASDLHIKGNALPIMRVNGNLIPLGKDPITAREVTDLFRSMTTPEQQKDFTDRKELDFSYQLGEAHRFRVNACLQKGELSLALRRVTNVIPSIEELGLPLICQELARKKQGLVLVTGPTGSGKSTTLAAMINALNQVDARRIITIEDPIEYIYRDQKSYITQRELGSDTKSFAVAARQALRQDPDVILVGEMRDPETMAACITAAETGHLVMSTLHTNNAPQSIDRIVDSFPPHQGNQIRMQLSLSLLAILSQRLLSRLDGTGRVPVVEVLVANNAIRNLIREGKTHQMLTVMQTSTDLGMQTIDQALQRSYQAGLITIEEALLHASDPAALRKTLGGF